VRLRLVQQQQDVIATTAVLWQDAEPEVLYKTRCPAYPVAVYSRLALGWGNCHSRHICLYNSFVEVRVALMLYLQRGRLLCCQPAKCH
jgi:hypothetical protein